MNEVLALALITAINRLAEAHERVAASAENSAKIAEVALTKQTELLSEMNNDIHG